MSAPRPQLLHAMALMVLAGLSFTVLDAMAKHLSARWPVPFIVWVRYSVHCLLMLLLLAPRMGLSMLRAAQPGLQLLRGVMLLLTTTLGFAALSRLPLAETLAIAFLSPLIVVLASIPLLGERPSRAVLLATLIGFGGMLLIVRPGGALFGIGVLFALGTAVSYAAYQLLTRHLSARASPLVLLFHTALIGSLGASFVVPFFWPPQAVGVMDALLLCSLGVFGGIGHFLLIRAFARAPASSLSPLLYIQLIWQTLAGWIVFDHLPDAWAVAGGLMIVGSGLIVFLTSRRDTA